MKKIERMNAFLRGEKIDRPPVSFWRHFYPEEATPDGLANAMLRFQEQFDWDFMKVNSRATYHAEAFGSIYTFPSGGSRPELLEPRIKTNADWASLQKPSLTKGVLRDHLRALELIADKLAGELHFVQTIFTPLSVAMNLCPTYEQFLKCLKECPEDVHSGLEVIAESFTEFADACVEAGASGIFLATTYMATTDALDHNQYEEFGASYDLEVLRPIQDKAKLLILHVCKGHNMLLNLLGYPVHMFNWDAADQTNPSLSKVSHRTEKCIMGGVDHVASFAEGKKEKALEEARDAFDATGGKRWALGAGCTIPMDADPETLRALRNAVEEMKL